MHEAGPSLPRSVRSIPDPERFANAIPAAKKIVESILQHKKILLVMDEDVDGLCSGSIMYRLMRQIFRKVQEERTDLISPNLNFEDYVDIHIPSRAVEGYGLSTDVVDAAHESGFGLIVTTDCGTSSVAALNRAAEQNIETVVIDHHTVKKDYLEQYPAEHFTMVNPNRSWNKVNGGVNKDEPSYLCASGVSMVMARALRRVAFEKIYGEDAAYSNDIESIRKRESFLNLKKYYFEAGLATSADIRQMWGVNQDMVANSAAILNFYNNSENADEIKRFTADQTLGPWYLTRYNGPSNTEHFNEADLNFNIGPLFNSARRLSNGDCPQADELIAQIYSVETMRQDFTFSKEYLLSGENKRLLPYPYLVFKLLTENRTANLPVGRFASGATEEDRGYSSLLNALYQINEVRRSEGHKYLDEAMEQSAQQEDRKTIFVINDASIGQEKWKQGVLDITARRISQEYGRPTVVITFDKDGHGVGWAKGFKRQRIDSVLKKAANEGLIHLLDDTNNFELHRSNLEQFHEFVEQLSNERFNDTPEVIKTEGAISIDELVSERFARKIESARPFGLGRQRPVYGIAEDLVIRPGSMSFSDDQLMMTGELYKDGNVERSYPFVLFRGSMSGENWRQIYEKFKELGAFPIFIDRDQEAVNTHPIKLKATAQIYKNSPQLVVSVKNPEEDISIMINENRTVPILRYYGEDQSISKVVR